MIFSNIQCKCQGCTDRYVGCHSKCEHYREYRKKMDKLNDRRSAANYSYLTDAYQIELRQKQFKTAKSHIVEKTYIVKEP